MRSPDREPAGPRLSTYKRPRSAKPVSALQLLQQSQQQSNGVPALVLQHPDWKLPIGSLTELAGPAGAGKTQLALTMCVDAVVLNQKAVYVALGGSNVASRISHRLHTMLLARTQRADITTTPTVTQEHLDDWLSRIYLHWVPNTEDLMELLRHKLPKLLQANPTIHLVVLDGIATLFRVHEDLEKPTARHWQARSSQFFHISQICKQLADQYAISFLIVNQATTRIVEESGTTTTTKTEKVEPALGLSWAQCVNASFFLYRTEKTYQPSTSNTKVPQRIRNIKSLRSPWLPANATLEFYIDPRGTVRIRK